MSEKKVATPVALAVGAALAGAFALGSTASASGADNPFEMTDLRAGYMLGETEGSCGGNKEGEGDKDGEASCGASGDSEGEDAGGDKDAEGSCGEGSCGGEM